MRTFAYPISGRTADVWQRSHSERAFFWGKSFFPKRDLADRTEDVELRPAGERAPKPLSREDFPLVVLTHNDMRFMPAFFAHYRAMGVTRFICVDDASDDGTRDCLLVEPDVDLFESNVRYADAARGKIWRERLLARYGLDRWYLIVDSDEFFVYETIGREPIAAYVRRLERGGVNRVPAPMLDLYPKGDLAAAAFTGRDGRMPWEVATHFDGGGYEAIVAANAISVHGGVRLRKLGARSQLMKYPLMRWDRYCSLARTIHRPRPALYNFPPVMAALLHFKIFSDLRERTQRAVHDGQHFDGAAVYRAVLDRLDTETVTHFDYEGSIAYGGVDDLLARGFMIPLPTGRSSNA
ncbi:glycosyltransferase family 2 protein [Pararhizobium mangrovi]|uniref:Glycosyltransferase family 2 protein n=1 Tax=Pararhizobium mangrovi TaxID=2590452 RepID=A0A506UBH7_9HYPH|nr:glycosyltransferase family 2 protein [Pararhizobium mangrovi]TPW30364.1 glycosyltransferase family 2 protein [Pararhizobium mangrovi]